ncbi:MAG TPA: 2-oxo-4-hydroxy-4-carboxy-5-ureidoimidazoline decarboxylase [Micromonosporaceae bacterium]|jgi:2-oxo-4-hydroxy-4-carboxy-5-ureidoimidazoline decarboxylase|nr:2-oxo-4-hydroxy-4-carboxy-5-ureidoimidazoline decarboxylase [Micromonosporaceae bacterium]
MAGLDRFNALPDSEARRELTACCATQVFTDAVAAGRPYPDRAALRSAADTALAGLDWNGVLEALAAHPRIGERATVGGREATWSADEQSAAASGPAALRERIATGNVEYEKRFGHVFLICANGRPAPEILVALTARLGNHPAAERDVVREELRKIVQLRLEKLLEG